MAMNRPLVVVFGKPVTKWGSAQAALADNENMISDLIQSSEDLGYVFYDRTTALGGIHFSIAVAEEMAGRLGFPTCFEFPSISKGDLEAADRPGGLVVANPKSRLSSASAKQSTTFYALSQPSALPRLSKSGHTNTRSNSTIGRKRKV
jgi:hypothetical protein